jgi:alanine-alpha-ketoisovalerate/valine-pyruvate aminotransferase
MVSIVVLSNSCYTATKKIEIKENVYLLLYNPKLSQALCGEFKYPAYDFVKWHQLEKCNGMICVGAPTDFTQPVLKPIIKPTPTPKWNDQGGGGSGWNDK